MNALAPINPDPGFVADVEQHVLGALLSGGNHPKVLAVLRPDHFLDPVHGAIYSLIQIAAENYNSTRMTVVAKLAKPEHNEMAKAATGVTLSAYMAALTSDTVHSASSAPRGAQAVIEQWARISLATQAAAIAEAARDPAAKPLELMRSAGRAFDDLGSELRAGGRGKTQRVFAEAADGAIAEAREARARGGLVGLTTGLVDVDRLTGGMQRSDLILIAARPSMGKTMLGITLACSTALTGVGVGFFSLEMDSRKLAARMVSDIGHQQGVVVPYQDLINGTAGEHELGQLEDALRTYRSLPLLIEDQTGLTISELRAKTESMLATAEANGFPLGLLVVDHLHKIRASSRYAGNRANEVSEMTDGLKALAREYNLAVVLLAQLNRAVESRDDKRPQLSDLRDSGAIEQDADVVAFLYRESYYAERAKPDDGNLDKLADWHSDLAKVRHRLEFIIGKQRNGPITTVDLFCDVTCSAVRNAARGAYC